MEPEETGPSGRMRVAEHVFTEGIAREQVDGARRFVAAAAGLLSQEGWLDGQSRNVGAARA